ncbi:hypothetical protein EJB05_34819, partial [Eragrostis curvula]
RYPPTPTCHRIFRPCLVARLDFPNASNRVSNHQRRSSAAIGNRVSSPCRRSILVDDRARRSGFLAAIDRSPPRPSPGDRRGHRRFGSTPIRIRSDRPSPTPPPDLCLDPSVPRLASLILISIVMFLPCC